ncbi:hypothetical protein M436DRAFT_84266 [Aureobasidium namibiae CBS 147.97]|uniref:RRM domain-containing protein n=1 Tax=Aureobasidium namibiae CBS 147.97 TaxID=1043004 RepID=A0A074X7V8_9PEZI
MSPWLEPLVTEKLADALTYKTAKHHAIKPEPDLLLQVSENGSNLKLKLDMPAVELRVLKVQNLDLTVTDGLVSMRARVTAKARDDFQKQYSSLLSSVETRSITSTISGITYTHLIDNARRVQLLLSSLAISNASCNNLSQITPIHEVSQIRTFLEQLQQLNQPANPPAFVHETIPPSTLNDNTHVEVTEPPHDRVEVVERNTPFKRPHSPSSSKQSSSHRLVRRRLHSDDEDIIVQTGLNLHQPVQLQPSASREHERLLSLLSSRGQSLRASTSADREQALRLISGVSAQMAPPPKPATRIGDLQAQAPSQVDSQSLSQDFQSQIPLAEMPASGPAESGVFPKGNAAVHFAPKEMTLPKISIPSNTPTSAQPESLEVTQSSLPRVSSQRVPLPSQSEALPASLATSSSHLLDEASSSIPKPLYRAPSTLFIKYARRSIPSNQRKLLDKPFSWWPHRPGTKFPHPNIPVEDLNKIEKAAEQRAAKIVGSERSKQIEEGGVQERRVRLSNTPPVTQGTQNSVLSWSSSPEHHAVPRYRNDTLRRSINIVESELPDNSQPDRRPPTRLLPGEFPPDSSADLMQLDDLEAGRQVVRIPSSLPPDYLSNESYGSDSDDDLPPESNVRQLPEYSLSSPEPEETSPRPDPEAQRGATESRSLILGESSHDGPLSKIVDSASSPVLQDAASPQIRETVEELSVDPPAGEFDGLLIQRDFGELKDAPVTNAQYQTDDDVVIDDQSRVKNDRIVDEQPRTTVTDLPAPQPLKLRLSDWGLKQSAETILLRQARWKREFFADPERKKVPDHDTAASKSLTPQTILQHDDEMEGNPESPVANTEPQPDSMEIDEAPIESAKPPDPNVLSRAAIIDQWRSQSDRIDYRPASAPQTGPLESAIPQPEVTAPGTEPPGPTVPEPEVAAPTGAKSTAPELPIPDAARIKESLPPKPLSADRAGPDTESVSSLPPRPSYRADVRMRDSKSRLRQEIEKGKFGEPTRALWVGSLPAFIDDTQLEQMFAEFSPVSAFAKNMSGFVNFADIETACSALEAKHRTPLGERSVVCKFASPRGFAPPRPAPLGSGHPIVPTLRPSQNATLSLTIDDLLRQLVVKRNFKGNRTAFETLCKNLHMSSDIPPSHWDDYVVLQPAEFLPWASRTIANGGKVLDYDTYWREHLQNTIKPGRIPVLTRARLAAIFNKTPVVERPPAGSSAPVCPQTGPGVRQPVPPTPHRTPPPAAPLAPRAVAEDLRRSVVERNASSATSTPQKVVPTGPSPLLDLAEPLRSSKWLRHNFIKDPNGRVIQQELYGMYKDEFARSAVPVMAGKLFVKHVQNTYPGQTVVEIDADGNKTFYSTGLRHKLSSRPPPADDGSPEFKIKGVSTLTSVKKSTRGGMPDESHSSPGERERRPPRRSLPFRAEPRLSRSRSPPRNPPPRAPKGKLYSPDHLLTDEDLDASSEPPEYRDFLAKYRALGNVTKKGNAFSERD